MEDRWVQDVRVSIHDVLDVQLSDDERAVFGGIPPGRYWYDKTSGLWGREGMPVEGQTLPDMNLGGALRSDASGGASGVFLNGRELPALELLSLNPPGALRAEFAGDVADFRKVAGGMAALMLAALLSVYIILGILYESLVHPITIISTLPSAGLGALLSLELFGVEFTIIAFIGILLLIGIVKKNGIMLVDFALQAERDGGMSVHDAALEAARERFRPILMTTLAATFGALPLAFATGIGAELRRPLGITIVGGLLLSQALTLYTTPVIYLLMSKLRRKKPAGQAHERMTPLKAHGAGG